MFITMLCNPSIRAGDTPLLEIIRYINQATVGQDGLRTFSSSDRNDSIDSEVFLVVANVHALMFSNGT